jgi:1-deoxy-D-xylulose-5-phosphate reductoisomerase
MKKKIIILGSTGSIGKNTIKIIGNDKKNFDIKLLSTNKNISELIKQAKKFKVKNLIISDYKKFIKAKKKYKNFRINFYNSFSVLDKLFKKKEIFYSMVSIVGIDGLKPSIQLIKYSQNIGIVNKESLICGWNLIKKDLIKFKTKFIPIDSEHFSIFSLVKDHNPDEIEKIYITASGGPFLKYPKSKFKDITLKNAINHPSWSMGKKISIDSSTMMNKVFEVIEARNIFNIDYKKILILTHPKSYVHALVKFTNGLTKILLHETDMKIPIHNSIYSFNKKKIKSKSINFDILNNLEFKRVDYNKFPLIKILNKIPKNNSLYETVLISINDYFVSKFLNKMIKYEELIRLINLHINSKKFTKFRKIPVKNVKDIYKTRDYVSLKLDTLGI